jgi:hypothetical protein
MDSNGLRTVLLGHSAVAGYGGKVYPYTKAIS